MSLKVQGHFGDAADPDCEVRERQGAASGNSCAKEAASPLAHPSDRLLIQLSPTWRVVDDDLQFILEHRKGTARFKATGWRARAFCRTREALLRCIREYCRPVDEESLQQVRALPEWHVDR
jgi:hypothetical protein